MPAHFEDIDETGKPFLSISQSSIQLLESISADEKGQAVPYIRIWQVDPRTGEPVHGRDGEPTAPINIQTSEPPRFGASADVRFRERPDVSLDRISVKAEAPKGIIQFQKLTINVVVHNPEVFNTDREGFDDWSTLILPGSTHILEYGWSASSGVKNGILNGEGFGDTGKNPPVVVPGRKRLPFTVTNYAFQITPDNQIKLSIEAYENGEFNLRQATLGGARLKKAQEERGPDESGAIVAPKKPADIYQQVSRDVIEDLKRRISKLRDKQRRPGPKLKPVVRFGDFADEVLAPTIDDALREMGFNDIRLIFGKFNSRTGRPADKYGGQVMSDRSIGDFEIPLQDIEKVFGDAVESGLQITLLNFVKSFLYVFQDARTWDRKRSKKNKEGEQNQKLPQVMLRVVTNPRKKSAVVFLFDVNREFTKFTDDDRKKGNEGLTRDEVRRELFSKGIPVISFMKGNSYIKDANFDVMNDDQMKSIFMRRYLESSRAGLGETNIAKKLDRSIDPRQLLYSSMIRGTVTMIGNFALDLFSLVWVEFGVKRWDGPFRVIGHEDDISKGEFERKIELFSEGDDPLGTQGRIVNSQRAAIVENDRSIDESRKSRMTPNNRNRRGRERRSIR